MNTTTTTTHPQVAPCGAVPHPGHYGTRITAPCTQPTGHTGCHVSPTTSGATGWHTTAPNAAAAAELRALATLRTQGHTSWTDLHELSSVGYTIRVQLSEQDHTTWRVLAGQKLAGVHTTQAAALAQAANLVLLDLQLETGEAQGSLEVAR